MINDNIYYRPLAFGLEVLHVLDQQDLDYEFNMFVVWRDINTGELFYCIDSGCSCPAPFEDKGRQDLIKLSVGDSFNSFCGELDSWAEGYRWDKERGSPRYFISDSERQAVKDSVAGRLLETKSS